MLAACLYLGLIHIAMAAQARADTHPALVVTKSGAVIHLTVSRDSTVASAMRIVCKEAAVKCTGVELLGAEMLPPMILQGKFTDVMRQLVQGLPFNFYYGRENETGIQTLVLSRATPGVEPRLASDQADSASENRNSTVATPQPVIQTGVAPAPNSPDVTFTQPSGAQQSAQPLSALEMMQRMFSGDYGTQTVGSEFLPFPDENGNPIPSKQPDMQFLPFPDEFGRPVPAIPAKPGSPFPLPPEASVTK